MTAQAMPMDPLHRTRLVRTLRLGSAAMMVLGVLWGAHLYGAEAWPLAVAMGAMVPLGALTLQLTQAGRARLAARVLVASLYALLTLNAWIADAPGPLAPRSSHHWLLLLGIGACILLRHERPWLRHGAPLACLLTYAVLASTYAAPAIAAGLAPQGQARVLTTWLDSTLAVVLLYVVLLVMQSDARGDGRRERELRDAILRDQLVLHLQPLVDERGSVIGAEALVRWQHPERGLVPPGEFIPLAEDSGLIVPLGEWVLRSACGQLAHWAQRAQTADLCLAVNVSAAQFSQADFVARTLALVQAHAFDPSRLKLEITESVLALGSTHVADSMRRFRAHGIRLSLDDFGTGFSSLAALRQLPLDQLKIDQSFTRAMGRDSKDLAIVQAIIDMAASLELEVVAEGVETAAQRERLSELGCRRFQGYLFGRPMPLQAFEAHLARQQLSRPVASQHDVVGSDRLAVTAA